MDFVCLFLFLFLFFRKFYHMSMNEIPDCILLRMQMQMNSLAPTRFEFQSFLSVFYSCSLYFNRQKRKKKQVPWLNSRQTYLLTIYMDTGFVFDFLLNFSNSRFAEYKSHRFFMHLCDIQYLFINNNKSHSPTKRELHRRRLPGIEPVINSLFLQKNMFFLSILFIIWWKMSKRMESTNSTPHVTYVEVC